MYLELPSSTPTENLHCLVRLAVSDTRTDHLLAGPAPAMSNRAASRGAQAFEALMASDDDADPPPRSRRRSGGGRGGGRAGAGGRGAAVPGFRLREEAAAAGPARPSAAAAGPLPGPAAAGDLSELREMFAGVLPAEVVADVWEACGRSLPAAADALLGMAGAPAGPSAAGPPAAPAPAAPDQEPAGEAAAHCGWDTLPQECKLLVLGRLSLADVARAARISREFAAHMREQRASMRSVVVPAGALKEGFVLMEGFVRQPQRALRIFI